MFDSFYQYTTRTFYVNATEYLTSRHHPANPGIARMRNIPQLYGYSGRKMRSECDAALDNPSGGCPTAPMGIRSPHTIIIGNIRSQVSKTEFSTACRLPEFTERSHQMKDIESISGNPRTVTVNTSQPRSHNPGNVQRRLM